MRLAACVPTVPAQLVSSLEKCGIRTDADLLFSGSTWDIFRRLPAGTTTLQGLEKVKALVANLASAPGQSAMEMIAEFSEPDDGFLTGLPPLDEILNGLTTSRRLIEVSGDKGSGKTSFVLQLVLHHLVYHPHSSVVWVDTTGDFSAARASEILELFDEPDALRALERLHVSSAFEVDTVYEVLEELRFSFAATPPPDFRIRGIVIDTIASLFGPILSPVSSQGHAIMTGFMRQLRAFAQSFSLAVFVVNNSVVFTPFVPGSASNNPNIRKPALGPSFTFLTDATLWLATCKGALESDAETTRHVIQVYRSKVTALKPSCAFKIRQGVLWGGDDTT
ncbi:P-loop containing nucleoside triphosphate hydrolase protein [Mycena alexandri]|uniref:P-loop containing nucleoside triphosphate hydrolase protein n=1 Tax=Mycena alexandri TaxID=1745969 RepID=A0AAD6TL90_9AGAR|nr:P-loop containing nucleoside triphosphate hydrolase protein [Mycena alexandri]